MTRVLVESTERQPATEAIARPAQAAGGPAEGGVLEMSCTAKGDTGIAWKSTEKQPAAEAIARPALTARRQVG